MTEVKETIMTKVVYNNCFGGFGVSAEGMKEYARLKGFEIFPENSNLHCIFWTIPEDHEDRKTFNELEKKKWSTRTVEENKLHTEIYTKYTISPRDLKRTDPVLVQVVETLGSERASGSCAELRIADIQKGTAYRIGEYDGNESIEVMDDIDWDIA